MWWWGGDDKKYYASIKREIDCIHYIDLTVNQQSVMQWAQWKMDI